MIRIAIYNDLFCGKKNCLASLVSQFFLSKKIPHNITEFDNGIELLKVLKSKSLFDIVFFDIMIPRNLSLPAALTDNNQCVLVFYAYFDEFTHRDNPVYTFDYFFYSAKHSTILSSLEKVLVRINKNKRHIPIKINGCMQDFPTSKIIYIESSKHYLFFHITSGMILKTYAKLDEYENILSGYNNFLRCHQSFIVNMDYIKQLSGHDFILEGDIHIPIRKSGFSLYKKKYFTYTLIKNCDNSMKDY